MARSTIDPITRIEGHLSIEMEVNDGVVTEAWVAANLFRGMELVLEGRTPYDAALITQRICGVCPTSHCHTSCLAAEQAYGIKIPEGGRIVRNLVEGAQFLRSNIQWFYNLNALDYVNPLNGLTANVGDCYDLCLDAGTSTADFGQLKERLAKFATNGQLSIFSGNWFDTESTEGEKEYKLTPEIDLVMTQHYIEGMEMLAYSDEVSAIIGGKMPHIMTSHPGGTAFMPTAEKMDDVIFRIQKIKTWVENTMVPDVPILASFYPEQLGLGKAYGRYLAWGVFDRPSMEMNERYMPSGILSEGLELSEVDDSLIAETTAHAFYSDNGDLLHPSVGVTEPEYPADGADNDGKYSWCKSPRYDGKPWEAGPLARVLVAYQRGDARIVELVDQMLANLGGAPISALESTLGRAAARACETLYTAELMLDWCNELLALMAGGEVEYHADPVTTTGAGSGLWEAPRGALYHYEEIEDDRILKYQQIIPTTWNIGPRDADGVAGPVEMAAIGLPVGDIEKPINALRMVHSFDPCTACSVHISEPETGKSFSTVLSPWGVR